jgi:hypothetical protein
VTTGTERRPPVFGPERWAELAGRPWCHWDLWFAVVTVSDHSGDLEALEAHLVGELRRDLSGRAAAEAKLSHLVDLRSRLAGAGIAPGELVTPQVIADKRVLARARKKLSDRSLEGRAMTTAMVDTPRVRLERRARHGRWGAFPVDPGPYYRSFRRLVEGNPHITKHRSFTAVDRVDERLRSLDRPDLTPAQRLGLYRAFHTAALNLADRTDDSHGNVGRLRGDAWRTYLGLDWKGPGLPPGDYWADVCDLVVTEPYGLDLQEETLPWLGVRVEHAELVQGILTGLASECRSSYLDHEADQALQHLAWLAVAGQRLDRFVPVATLLGSDHWRPIEALAESALRSGRRGLAVEVFRAADRPGWHQEHLRARCRALTGRDLLGEGGDPRPPLRSAPDPGGR